MNLPWDTPRDYSVRHSMTRFIQKIQDDEMTRDMLAFMTEDYTKNGPQAFRLHLRDMLNKKHGHNALAMANLIAAMASFAYFSAEMVDKMEAQDQ